jgi:ribulose bisphosphate carboxylase small subunit
MTTALLDRLLPLPHHPRPAESHTASCSSKSQKGHQVRNAGAQDFNHSAHMNEGRKPRTSLWLSWLTSAGNTN